MAIPHLRKMLWFAIGNLIHLLLKICKRKYIYWFAMLMQFFLLIWVWIFCFVNPRVFLHFENFLYKKEKFFKGSLITYFTIAVQSLSSISLCNSMHTKLPCLLPPPRVCSNSCPYFTTVIACIDILGSFTFSIWV